MRSATFLAVVLLAPAALPAHAAEPGPTAAGIEFFEKQVRPLLVEHCLACHGPEKQRGGLRLDSRAGFHKGSDSGPLVKQGTPQQSLLLKVLSHTGETKMPPRGKLPAPALEVFAAWVKMGTPWPDDAGSAGATQTLSVERARRTHWAFQPVRRPPAPAVRDGAWCRTPIDHFILAALEARRLGPTAEADRRTLLRRVTFDLTGLPPTLQEIGAFLADGSPDAYERVVERLLASLAYGERWGRHWLDVARYADTKGYVFQEERRYPFAYTYRDWVVRALNEDLPYDQFLIEQLAADLLPSTEDNRHLAALGFLTLGRRFLNNVHDIIDDRIDVTLRGLQGLTVGCARCHDHKFDAIPQTDYYSLYGVFASSTEPKELPVIAEPEQTEAYRAYLAELKKRQDAVKDFQEQHKAELAAKNRKFRDQLRNLEKLVDQWQISSPASPPRAMVLADIPAPVEPRVFLRGNPNNRGPAVPRQYLEVVAGPGRKPFTKGSGRLELARAIASKDNPLTARVLVNRVWMHHFGQGLVRTPGNFGARGEPPTHPELLDWLASDFVEHGWSLKQLHRRIVLSAVYRQGSGRSRSDDPENRLLSHFPRRRLEYEALRDSMLAVAGRLERTMGGAAIDALKTPSIPRRTVYGFIDRQNLPGVLRTFDFASPDATVPQRHQTTVPQQALFLMNSPFVVEQARALAARPEVIGQARPEARIQRLHELLYGRPADADEIALGLRFLTAAAAAAGTPGNALGPWEQYAQVLLLANEFTFVD
jgi:mono/diheme cytochrome c family protein